MRQIACGGDSRRGFFQIHLPFHHSFLDFPHPQIRWLHRYKPECNKMSVACASVGAYEVSLTKKLTVCIRKIEKWVNEHESTGDGSKYHAKMRAIFTTEIDLLCSKLVKGKYYDATEYIPCVKVRGNNQIGIKQQNNRQMKTLVASSEVQGDYIAPKGVKWDKLLSDIVAIVLADGNDKPVIIEKIRNEIFNEKEKILQDERKIVCNENIRRLNNRNMQPVLPGSWRKLPYDLRVYAHIDEYVPSSNLLLEEQENVIKQLDTSLYGYLGESYNYDDHELTQQWASTLDISKLKKAKDSLIIHLQIERLMDQLTQKVQDKVSNENGVLEHPIIPIGSLLKECAVFGIDCYTRRMVELVIEDRVKPADLGTYQDITNFIEHKLLVRIPSLLATL